MLRGLLGDSAFFDLLKAYSRHAPFRYSHVNTSQFQAFCESTTGMDLDFFFDQWIYDDYYPVYHWGYKSGTHGLKLKIRQIQNEKGWRPVFSMPVPVHITFSDDSDTTLFVWNDSLEQDFVLNLSGQVSSVEFDPDGWIHQENFHRMHLFPDSSNVEPAITSSPNPFSEETLLHINLPETGRAHLTIFDILGREVDRILNDTELESGDHFIPWNARKKLLSTGIYMIRFKTGRFEKVIKTLYIK